MSKCRIIEGVKITASIQENLEEARRRWENFQKREHRSVTIAWIGLGSRTAYQESIDAGLICFIHPYPPRIDGWLQFTPKGVAVFAVWCSDRLNTYENAARELQPQLEDCFGGEHGTEYNLGQEKG